MRRLIIASVFSAIATQAANASELSVTVKDTAGQPVNDAVVTLRAPGSAAHGPIHFSWPYAVAQEDVAFHPFVLIVPAGAEVRFPNKDRVRHHVYSFSPAKVFQLKLYGQDETRTVQFDRPGVVALGCNIHDRMIGFIDVVDTPWAAKTVGGRAVISDAPTGAVVMTVWHPFSKAKGQAVSKDIVMSAKGAEETVTLDLRPSPKSGK